MGPFGDEEDAEIVDGQVIGSSPPQQQQQPSPMPGLNVLTQATANRGVIVLKIDPNNWPPRDGAPPPQDITDDFLAVAMNQRSRAYALFLEVPFLAYIALQRDLPSLVRVGAAVLGVLRALEVTERQAEFEQYFDELAA
jgi:hypothetical protein